MPCSPPGLGHPMPHQRTPLCTHTLPFCISHPLSAPSCPRGGRRKGEQFAGRSKRRGERLHGPIASQCHVLARDCQPGCAHGHGRAGGCGELLMLPQSRQRRESTVGVWGCSPQRPPSALPLEAGVSGRHRRARCHQVHQAQNQSMQTPERVRDQNTPRGPPKAEGLQTCPAKTFAPRVVKGPRPHHCQL